MYSWDFHWQVQKCRWDREHSGVRRWVSESVSSGESCMHVLSIFPEMLVVFLNCFEGCNINLETYIVWTIQLQLSITEGWTWCSICDNYSFAYVMWYTKGLWWHKNEFHPSSARSFCRDASEEKKQVLPNDIHTSKHSGRGDESVSSYRPTFVRWCLGANSQEPRFPLG